MDLFGFLTRSQHNSIRKKRGKSVSGQLIHGRNISAANAEEKKEGCNCWFKTPEYFFISGLTGMAATATARSSIIPLDLIKTRLQADATILKDVTDVLRTSVREEGVRALYKGWKPTLIGYSAQGFFKYGLYEAFKDTYGDMLGEENAYVYRTSNYLAAGASAEFLADIALSPMEALKVKIQTRGYSDTLIRAMSKMMSQEGVAGFYRGLIPLWMRQIPYTSIKFVSFERTPDLVYGHLVSRPQNEYTMEQQLLVTGVAGSAAGVIGSTLSHPADTVYTRVNQGIGHTPIAVIQELGFRGMWSGIYPKILMAAAFTSFQWLIYDYIKIMTDTKPPPPELPASMRKKKKRKKKKKKKTEQKEDST